MATLQIVIEGTGDYNVNASNRLNNMKIVQFNFDALVGQFDKARAGNPKLTSWALSPSLPGSYLGGSNTEALGGELAYRYAIDGNLGKLSIAAIHAQLGAAGFGVPKQTGAHVMAADLGNAGATVFGAPVSGNGTDVASSMQLRDAAMGQSGLNAQIGWLDKAGVGQAKLPSWALASSLLSFHLRSRDAATLGGDLHSPSAVGADLSGIALATTDLESGSAAFSIAKPSQQRAMSRDLLGLL